jgi:hypothetical protein
VYARELAALSADQRRAARDWPTLVTALLLVATLSALVAAQLWVRRRFHRTLNLGLLVATLAVLAGAVALTVALHDEGRALDRVATEGTAPLTAYSQARNLMFAADADDELTLLTHESVPAYQADYLSTWQHLRDVLQPIADVRLQDDRAALEDVHQSIRVLVLSNAYPRAIGLATDPNGAQVDSLPEASANLDADLASGVATAQHRFTGAIDDAARSLRGLAVALGLLGLLAGAAALLGLRARLREFR